MAGHVKQYEMIRTLFLDARTEKPGYVHGEPTHYVCSAVMLTADVTERDAKREAVKQLREYLAGKDHGRITEVFFSVYPEPREK